MTVHLDISSWDGISIGAVHHYGRLMGYVDGQYVSVELIHPLTKEMADQLNAKDDWDGYKEGMDTERFNTSEEVRTHALKTWREHFPGAVLLFEGSPTYSEPKRCLACPTPAAMKVFDKVFMWWQEMDRLNFPLEHDDREEANDIFEKMKEIIIEEKGGE